MSKHKTNYKPKDFAELLNVSVKRLQREDQEIAKSLQNGNKSIRTTKTKD